MHRQGDLVSRVLQPCRRTGSVSNFVFPTNERVKHENSTATVPVGYPEYNYCPHVSEDPFIPRGNVKKEKTSPHRLGHTVTIVDDAARRNIELRVNVIIFAPTFRNAKR